jgi:hypothetical protein
MTMSRTVVRSGVTWSVRDDGGGREEWIRISGEDAVGEFRTAGHGSCGVVDRAPKARKATAGTTRSRARRTGTTSPVPRVDRVVLRAQARQQVVEELCAWEDGRHEARETAGFLAGHFDGSTIVVTAAWGPGPDAVRSYGRVTLDLGYMDSIRNALLPGERIVGGTSTLTRRRPPGSVQRTSGLGRRSPSGPREAGWA